MIKRLIFDLDNTLMAWDNDYYDTLDQTFNYFNISFDENIKNSLINAVNDYEDKYDIFNYEYMNGLMKQYSSIDLPSNFVEKWVDFLGNAIPDEKDLELIDTLEYLSSKYELVVLTNWFTKSQKERLKNYGILKYFKEVIGTDLVKNKPNEESYIKACGSHKPKECIMIGDSLFKDIKGALVLGLKGIYYNPDMSSPYGNIKKISDLKNML